MIVAEPLRIQKIRNNRSRPGLRRQHTKGIHLVSKICNATTSGVFDGSDEISFYPRSQSPKTYFEADTETAGSIALLMQVSLPCLLFSDQKISVDYFGGTDADNAPQIDYMTEILMPILESNIHSSLKMIVRKRGFYPKGGGFVSLSVDPLPLNSPLPPICMLERGEIVSIQGRIVAPKYTSDKVLSPVLLNIISELQKSFLDITPDVTILKADVLDYQGISVVLWAKTSTGCILGGSGIASKNRNGTEVGMKAVQSLCNEINHGGCVDEYLQDQLIIFMALAEGESSIRTGPISLHTTTAISIAHQLTKPDFSHVDPTHLAVADYLRSSESKMKSREGILSGKRVQFFKGKSAVNALLRESYSKSSKRPAVSDRSEGEKLMNQLTKDALFFRVDKVGKSKHLNIHQHHPSQPPPFSSDGYYVWIYEGSLWKTYALGLVVVLFTLAAVMFPLWPVFMKTGVYYLSLGVLGLMGIFMVMVVIRLFIWIGLVLATGRGGWLFPNLFADVGIIESFIPTWGWDERRGERSQASRDAGNRSNDDDD
ncbi:hypothetical protein HK098_006242 [Nowakowskiella sp. JEL0407]|nr:hypothetical protein HK098_006242 [Nowakowskiella sp. JEL0407]